MFVRSPVLRKEQCVLAMSACKKPSLFSMIGDMLALSLSFVVFNRASIERGVEGLWHHGDVTA